MSQQNSQGANKKCDDARDAIRTYCLDWPLSQDEKKGRLIELFEKELHACGADEELLACGADEANPVLPELPACGADEVCALGSSQDAWRVLRWMGQAALVIALLCLLTKP